MPSDTDVCEALSVLRVLLPPNGLAALETIESRLNDYDALTEGAANQAPPAPAPGELAESITTAASEAVLLLRALCATAAERQHVMSETDSATDALGVIDRELKARDERIALLERALGSIRIPEAGDG